MQNSSTPTNTNNKPVFINLQRIGNTITFGVNNVRVISNQLVSSPSKFYANNFGLQRNAAAQNQSKICTPININLVHNQNGSIKQLTGNDKTNPTSNTHHYSTLAPQSKTIFKQKPVKRTYKRAQRKEAPVIPKFNFPLPPPKIDFTVSTSTMFNTAVDNHTTEGNQAKPLASNKPITSINIEATVGEDQSIRSNQAVLAESNKPLTSINIEATVGEDQSIRSNQAVPAESNKPITSINIEATVGEDKLIDIPSNCRPLKKITINTTMKKVESIAPTVTAASSADITSNEPDEGEADVHLETSNVMAFLESAKAVSNLCACKQAIKAVTIEQEGTEYGDIIKRLDRIEAMHMASSTRDAQILVAVKKLCLQFTKSNNDNEEIKKLLPLKREEHLIAMDIRIIEDPIFKEKLIAFLRGYKTKNEPETFTAFFNVLFEDGLVDKFNLKGIMGKKKLEGFKIMEIIQDLHKPMEKKIFEKIMRATIEAAKNRYHNDLYRKRQQEQKTKTMGSSGSGQ